MSETALLMTEDGMGCLFETMADYVEAGWEINGLPIVYEEKKLFRTKYIYVQEMTREEAEDTNMGFLNGKE